ncbi:MAG: 1-acyl-sn-glycerol-3-phosphate acyltransferase [Thermomicrobiales bacterium]|jgi:1-acyl-sn-glycerol-3-phosphate acyltransferase|nr:MAG: 1-acyl-sn-glycerol-3-phosphate acyltransferase [Thermomicrobiales bacterium]
MNLVRSSMLALLMMVTTPVFALLAMASFALPPHARYRIITQWTTITMWGVRWITGIRYEVRGRENLPRDASVILCKHQSAWETMAMQRIFPPVAFVLKKELLRVPFFGWGLAQMPIVSIDRSAGIGALEQVVQQGRELLAHGFWVVVFPEGTRVAPGHTKRYKVGGAHLAVQANSHVVPVAHNAGELWPRNAFVKRPGLITVSIGPAIDATGLTAEEVNRRAEAWIEGEMRRISPHRYPHAQDVARSAA